MKNKNHALLLAGASFLWVVVVIALVHGSHFYINRFVEDSEQPVQFSHSLHVNTLNLECGFCHQSAEVSLHATLPKAKICLSCHEGAAIENAEVEKMLALIKERGEIDWKRVYEVKDHVYFSHRVHTSLAKIDCAECHGPMGNMTVAVNAAGGYSARGFLEMGWCVTCHRDRNVTLECIACHK